MKTKLSLLSALLLCLVSIVRSQNLVQNASFETDTNADNYPDGWSPRPYASWEKDPTKAHSGKRALLLQAGPTGLDTWSQGAIYSTTVPKLKPKTQYLMSFWVRTEGLAGKDHINLFHNTSPSPTAGFPTAAQYGQTSVWRKQQFSFITGDRVTGGELHLGAQLSPNAKVWIDDIELLQNLPAVIQLQASSTTLMADGNSFSTIMVKIYDAYGNFLPIATNKVTFALDGPGQLVGANPNVCVNGQTAITYKTSKQTGTATIRCSSPGLSSQPLSLSVINSGHQGVPKLSPDYTKDVELEWWAYHPFNAASPNYNPNIISPSPSIDIATCGDDLRQAINKLPASGGTIVLQDGKTYYTPDDGICIAGRGNIHFISNGRAVIKARSSFSGVPRPGGKGINACMFQIQAHKGDWHDDNYASNAALADPARNFYFKNITFDGSDRAFSALDFWAVCDVVFDNCTFVGTKRYGMHIGAWSDNFWARGCTFRNRGDHSLLWDGTHGSGILNCTFENTIAQSVHVIFLSNDDCSRDVINNDSNKGTWQPKEIRLANYIVVEGNTFGANSTVGKVAIAASARNILVRSNKMLTGAARFYEIGPRCSQMTHQSPMPGYSYDFFDNRLVGNEVIGPMNEFALIRSNPNTNCSNPGIGTQPNTSRTGRYQVRGNVVGIVDKLVREETPNGNQIVGPNVVCGNCINEPDCKPNTYYDCQTPEPLYTDLGVYRNAGFTYYLDGTKGNDDNPGNKPDKAWKTLEYALSHITSASTLYIRKGLYILDNTREHIIGGDAAGGVSRDNATIIKAAPGERVIVSGSDGLPPRITLKKDFIRLEGIWFGGKWDVDKGHEFHISGGGRVDHGREIVGCTFFGYRSLRGGLVEHTLWQRNRFVRCGVANDPPMVYMSGNHGIGYGNHDIFDKNTFITGRGYALNGWHSYHNFVITRNFIANVWGGIIADGRNSEYQGNAEGSDHLIANNIFWNTGEGQGKGFNAATLIAANTHYLNNIHVDRSNIAVSNNAEYGCETLENFVVENNAFNNTPLTYVGKNHIEIPPGSERATLGVDKAVINAAIGRIDAALCKRPLEILADESIQELFRIVENIPIPSGSRLYGSGIVWDKKQKSMNIGTDIPTPGKGEDDFWQLLHARGIRQWNSEGNMVFVHKQGAFADGSGKTNYRGPLKGSGTLDFKAIIAPENAKSITIRFKSFDTEAGGDFVRICDENGKELDKYSGSTELNKAKTYERAKVILHFRTNNDGRTGQGWSIEYSAETKPDGVDSPQQHGDNGDRVTIYPNPVARDLHITIGEPHTHATYTIYDLQGEQIQSGRLQGTQMQTDKLQDTDSTICVRNIPEGIYLIQITVDGLTIVRKIVIARD